VLVSNDGESSWLEGAALLGIYLILGLAFFVLP
jgi:Ca2+:H+ antiporter